MAGRTVFEIAQALQEKIENDTMYPFRQKEAIRQSFLADDRMPAIMTQNRLDAMNNRFETQNRENTWESELGYNQATMEGNRLTAEDNLATFRQRKTLADLQREKAILDARTDLTDYEKNRESERIEREATDARRRVETERDNFTLGNLDRQHELWENQLDRQISDEKSSIIENESLIETRQYDDQFKAIMDKYPDIDDLPQPQKVEIILKEITNKEKGVKDRAKLYLRETVGKDYLQTLNLIEQAAIETASLSPDSTESQKLAARRLQRQAQSALGKFDVTTFYELVNSGVIRNEEFSANAEAIIEAYQAQLTQAQESPLPTDGTVSAEEAPVPPNANAAENTTIETQPSAADGVIPSVVTPSEEVITEQITTEEGDFSVLTQDKTKDALLGYVGSQHTTVPPQAIEAMADVYKIDLDSMPSNSEQALTMATDLINRSEELAASFAMLKPEYQEAMYDLLASRIFQLQTTSQNQ